MWCQKEDQVFSYSVLHTNAKDSFELRLLEELQMIFVPTTKCSCIASVQMVDRITARNTMIFILIARTWLLKTKCEIITVRSMRLFDPVVKISLACDIIGDVAANVVKFIDTYRLSVNVDAHVQIILFCRPAGWESLTIVYLLASQSVCKLRYTSLPIACLTVLSTTALSST